MPEMDLSVKIGIVAFVGLLIVALVLFHVYFSPPPPRRDDRNDDGTPRVSP